jgi:hypothetical protein
MSVQNISTCVANNAALADFKSWAKAISDWMASIGWVQTNDTGQVVWTATVLTCTQVAMSGTTATISYSSFTGPAPRVGMSVTFSGFTNGGNNAALTLTVVSGGSSGTVQAVNASGVNETHSGSGTTTALASPPGTSTLTAYELWASADALSSTLPIIVKFEYGTSSTTAAVQFAFSAGTGSNGSGTLTGNVSTRYVTASNVAGTAGLGLTSLFAGDTSRFAILMFLNAGSTSNGFFCAIERSHDSSGADTDSYFNFVHMQNSTGAHNWIQQIVQKPILGGTLTAETNIVTALTTLSSGVVGTNIALGPMFPVIGKLDNPCMAVAFSKTGDIVEGATVIVPYYGTNHTMYCTKFNTCWTSAPGTASAVNGFLFRYE